MVESVAQPLYRRVHPRQVIKWTVYGLLLFNFALYIGDDWGNAQAKLRTGGDWLDWAGAFGTSLDLAAWFGLLLLWELETYVLPAEAHTRFLRWSFLSVRLVCYVFIAHTVASRAVTVNELRSVQPEPGLTSLCQLTGSGVSYARNVEYTLIDADNCAALSKGNQFWYVDNSAITDAEGLRMERQSTWIDLQDAIAWLLVMLTIEIAIWLQNRDITGGALMFASRAGKVLYALLMAHAVYWAWRGHWLYAWDQFLWIAGFFAIELNVQDWRKWIEMGWTEHATNG